MRNALILPVLAGALLASCGGQASPDGSAKAGGAERAPTAETAPVTTPTPQPDPTAMPAAAPVAAAAASDVRAKSADYSFTYAYPTAAAAIAPLAAWLNADRARVRAKVARDSAAYRREVEAGGSAFHPYESTTTWKVVTDTPRLLSLSADTYDYLGGAHGSPGFRAVVWDKGAGRRLDPSAVFASEAAIQSALGNAFCRALDGARGKRRGVPVVRSNDGFNDCPKVAEATLILGSTDRTAIDRIGLLVPPYVAGPFAEGSYDLTLPVTPAVIAAVKPAYRDAFAPRR